MCKIRKWGLCGLAAGAGQDHAGGFEKDFKIEPERPLVDVFQVQFHPVVKADIVTAGGDLPQAGDAGLHGKPAALPQIVFLYFRRDRRPGPHDALPIHPKAESVIWEAIFYRFGHGRNR